MRQTGPGSDGNKGVLRITQAPGLQEPHHIRLVSYPGQSLVVVESHPFANKQSVYSTALADSTK